MKARKVPLFRMQHPEKIQMQIAGEGYASDEMYVKRVIEETASNKEYMQCLSSGKKSVKSVRMLPMGLDIETTTITREGASEGVVVRAYMYIWQMVIGDFVIYGRTWSEWRELMAKVQKGLNLGKDGNVTTYAILWIANLSFEFHFIAQQKYNGFSILKDTFASGSMSPLTAEIGFTDDAESYGFKCMDCLQIGENSLASLAKSYCVTQKATGDLDYNNKIRNSKTPLTEKELGYCRNDVVILHEWARYYIEAFMKQCHVMPITKTGILRKTVQQEFDEACNDDAWLRSKTLYAHPMFDEYYNAFKYLYRGGYTHANYSVAGKAIPDVTGRDFTSSYPAVMLQESFPVNFVLPEVFRKGKYADITTVNDLDRIPAGVHYTFTVRLNNVMAKTNHSLESIAKLHEFDGNYARCVEDCGIIEDNGRILFAMEMTVSLTELDWAMYKEMYTWYGNPEITDLMLSESAPMPEWFTKIVKLHYKNKAKLKRSGQEGTSQYKFAKAMVNALYGLTVERIHFDDFKFNEEGDGLWHTDSPNIEDDYAKMWDMYEDDLWRSDEKKKEHRGKPHRPLSPYYGIYVTAFARKRIIDAILACGDDALYSDTDSVYIRNYKKRAWYFDNWNKKIAEKNKALFGEDYEWLGDLGEFDPVKIEGVDENGNDVKSEWYTFCTMGAKRYIKFDKHYNLETTIAGLPKKALKDKVLDKYGDVSKKEMCEHALELFSGALFKEDFEMLVIEGILTGKKGKKYNNKPHEDWVTDDYGNTELMHEDSSIALIPASFSMKVKEGYKNLIVNGLNDVWKERFE